MTVDNDNNKIRLAITHGDFNGIGYEVIIKALADPHILELCTPIVYGSSKVASYHKKTVDLKDFNFNLVKSADVAHPKRHNIVNVFDKEVKIELGKSSDIAGQVALLSMDAAVEDLKKNLVQAIVTAPINKKNMQSDKFRFHGHTEYFAEKFQAKETLMIMVSDKLRIGIATGHIPIAEVAKNITKDLILQKLRILSHSLSVDFGIQKPKIAVLGLNPHASDDGLIGNEEKNHIIPAISEAFNNEKILAFGPFPADGFFGNATFLSFDAVLGMYHDQALIPFKTLSFDEGVNFTAGLPIIRTSPGHGTAYEIAGKNLASPNSFRNAIYLACDIYKNRLMHSELTANQLKTTHIADE